MHEVYMANRKQIVAGSFYPGTRPELQADIANYLKAGKTVAANAKRPAYGAMLPHAGYIFCGEVIGKTLAGESLPPRLVILCPNHTGYGKPLGVWADGYWQTPLGNVEVDAALARELINSNTGFETDFASHYGEHSIEVLLPFLQAQATDLRIVPVCVGTHNFYQLENAARGLAMALADPANANVGIIVSSDMNHYEAHDKTLAKDQLALERILAKDARGLLATVQNNHISMCGAAPMALAMLALSALGKYEVELAAHTTSGPVSGDMQRTVGYAGIKIIR